MKNSSQRKISFLVVLLGMASFMPARAQLAGKLPGERGLLMVNGPGKMLKSERRNFLSGPVENGFSVYTFMFSENPDAGYSGRRNAGYVGKGYPESRYTGNTDAGPRIMNPGEWTQYRVPADFYYCQSGFFCKREWKLEKATHIPFRFRLGSLDYCNALEGKH